MRHLISLLLLLPLSVAGQSIAVNGPKLGLLLDPDSGRLRQILGIPGAMGVSDSLELETDRRITKAAFPPGHSYALAEVDGQDAMFLLQPGNSTLVPIPGVGRGTKKIEFSPSGDSAVVFYPRSSRLLVLKDLPTTPEVESDIDPSGLGRVVTPLAIADQAKFLLIGIYDDLKTDTRAGGLFLMDAAGSTRRISSSRKPIAVSLFLRSKHALIVDGQTGSLHMIRDVEGVAREEIIPQVPGIESGVAGIASSNDGLRIVIAHADGVILVLDAAGAEVARLNCGFMPQLVQAAGQPSSFWVQGGSGGDLVRIDAGSYTPNLWFVPRLRRAQ